MELLRYQEIIDEIWSKKYSTYENTASIHTLAMKKYGILII